MQAVNVLGTENVIQACLDELVAKLVYVSSMSVHFDGTGRYCLRQKGVSKKMYSCARDVMLAHVFGGIPQPILYST